MFGQTLVAGVRGVAGVAGEGLLAGVDPLVGSHPLLVVELPVRYNTISNFLTQWLSSKVSNRYHHLVLKSAAVTNAKI